MSFLQSTLTLPKHYSHYCENYTNVELRLYIEYQSLTIIIIIKWWRFSHIHYFTYAYHLLKGNTTERFKCWPLIACKLALEQHLQFSYNFPLLFNRLYVKLVFDVYLSDGQNLIYSQILIYVQFFPTICRLKRNTQLIQPNL